jgi:hypothetical protein
LPKTKYEYALYTIQAAGGGLFRACRVDPNTGSAEPLPLPYGDKVERRWAVREASNALYRELCLGLRSDEKPAQRGLSADFKITSR